MMKENWKRCVVAVSAAALLFVAYSAVMINDGISDHSLRRLQSENNPPPPLKEDNESIAKQVNTEEAGGETTTAITARSKISAKDKAAEVWVINQPKCGTGSFTGSVMESLHCNRHNQTGGEYWYKCPNDIMLYQSHRMELAEGVKRSVNNEKKAAGSSNDKCVVLSAIRNPILSIPSRFFEEYKEELCDGQMETSFVLGMYEHWLRTDWLPKNQLSKSAAVLRAFGITDFRSAIDRLAEHGYTHISSNDPNSPWFHCELLFMMIDYDEENVNLQKAFDETFDGIKYLQVPNRKDLCPKAAGMYQALLDYTLTEAHIQVLAKNNPELLAGIEFYRKFNQDNARTITAVS